MRIWNWMSSAATRTAHHVGMPRTAAAMRPTGIISQVTPLAEMPVGMIRRVK